jgi:glycosyltransferase involved in cell wall biosynthesis
MKICYLADAESIHTGRWVRYFANQGHEVHLISKKTCRPMKGVRLHLLRRLPESAALAPLNLFFTVIQIRKIIKRIAPDMLHSHYILDYGLYGSLAGFHPFVASAWGTDVLIVPNQSKILRALTRYALERANMITCDGENSMSAIIDLGIHKDKIKLISHGIDTGRFHPGRRNEVLRAELGLSGHSTVISMRNLKPIYDLASFVEAIPLVLREVPDVKFIVAGDGAEKEALVRLAKDEGVLDHVIFTGEIAHERIPDYLASSDVYISTSLSDGGIAVSTLEAMASGLAPIVTDVGDARRWIKDGINGFVVPTRDPAMMADKIIYILQNREVLKRFGAANRLIIKERADYYREMEKMGRIYESLIEEHKR